MVFLGQPGKFYELFARRNIILYAADACWCQSKEHTDSELEALAQQPYLGPVAA